MAVLGYNIDIFEFFNPTFPLRIKNVTVDSRAEYSMNIYCNRVCKDNDNYFLLIESFRCNERLNSVSGTVSFINGIPTINGKENGRLLTNCIESEYGYDDIKDIFRFIPRKGYFWGFEIKNINIERWYRIAKPLEIIASIKENDNYLQIHCVQNVNLRYDVSIYAIFGYRTKYAKGEVLYLNKKLIESNVVDTSTLKPVDISGITNDVLV